MLLAILLLLSTRLAYALNPERLLAEYHHTSWTKRQNAPRDALRLAQVTDGYLWIGAASGLYRFDGFAVERVDVLDGVSISGSGAVSLQADAAGGLWIGFADIGLAYYSHGHLARFSKDKDFKYAASFVSALSDGSVWLKLNGHLAQLVNGNATEVGDGQGFPASAHVHTILLDREETLWVTVGTMLSSGQGGYDVYFLPKGKRKFQKAPAEFQAEFIASSSDGTVWGCGDSGLQVLMPGFNYGVTKTLLAEPCGRILLDREGGLWLHEAKGLRHFGKPEELFRASRSKRLGGTDFMTVAQGLSSNEINDIVTDRDGNVWLATTSGLDRFRDTSMTPIALPGRNGETSIADGGDGSVWATRGGSPLIRVDTKNVWTYPQALRSDGANVVYQGRDGNVYFASSNVGSLVGRSKFAALPPPGVAVTTELPRAMTVDAEGALWVAGGDRGKVARYFDGEWTIPAGKHGFPAKWSSSALLTDSRGRLWGGSAEDVLLVENGEARLLTRAETGIDVGVVHSLSERQGRLWVAGVDGIAFYDGHRFHSIKGRGEIAFQHISGIVETTDGELWLSGPENAWRITAEQLKQAVQDPSRSVDAQRFDVFDGIEGLGSMPFFTRTLVQGADGLLWFATASGVAWIDPHNIAPPGPAPTVVVKSVLVDSHKFNQLASPLFPALSKRVEFEYTALAPGLADRIRFRYRLEGSDADWQDADERRRVSFNDLPPGGYRFRVKSTDLQGDWNGKEASYAFRIAPAWYQTLVFKLFAALTCLFLVFIFYRWRVSQLTMSLRVEARAQKSERERISRELHDTLLQSVNGLAWRIQALFGRLPADDLTRRGLEDALDLVDKALDQSRDQVVGLRRPAIDDQTLVAALTSMGQIFSRDLGIGFQLQDESSERDLPSAQRKSVLRILSEALSNAFLHSGGPTVHLQIRFDPDQFVARVRDHGQGIAPEVLRAGRSGHLGLLTMRERAKGLGATLSIESEPQGTVVTLILPARYAYVEQRSGRGHFERLLGLEWVNRLIARYRKS